jgi:LuxR family maltose regulon positive regulatory protein
MTGRSAEHWLRAAEECQRAAESELPDDLPSVPVAIALLRGALAKAGPVAMGADAERAYGIAALGDPSRALAAFHAGVSHSFRGDSVTALKWLEEGEQLATLLGLPATRAACLGQRAILAFHGDDWAGAGALTTRAVAIATQFGLENVNTMVPVYAASALSLAHQHRVDEALREARRARRMTTGIARGVNWQAHQFRILLARAYLLLGDAENSRLLVDEARKATGPGTADLCRDLEDLQRLTDAIPAAGQTGAASITPAERRVLQLLKTHLSFSEIGDALLRSRNTVKTQAISIYRKLDVGSRGEAVEQATKLGLN